MAPSTGGGSFDDFQEMKVDMFRSAPRTVSKVTIRSGAHVDAVSPTLSDGTILSHGGSGGTARILSLASDEWVTRYDLCYDRYNGSDRLFYLERPDCEFRDSRMTDGALRFFFAR